MFYMRNIVLHYSYVVCFQLKLMEQKPTVPVLMVTALLMQPVPPRCVTVTPDTHTTAVDYVQVQSNTISDLKKYFCMCYS